MTCPNCQDTGKVPENNNRGGALVECYLCRFAGRLERSVQPRIDPAYHALIRRATQNKLPTKLTLTPGRWTDDCNALVRSTVIDWALANDKTESLQKLAEVMTAIDATQPKHKPVLEITNRGVGPYDTTGLTFRPCRTCRTPIAFVTSDKGKKLPVTREGMSHYLDCEQANEHSRKAA